MSCEQVLKVNHLEIHARAFAAEKARELAGTVVDSVLTHTGAEVPDRRQIPEAEAYITRWLTAMLKNSLVEFSRMYTAALDERIIALERMVELQPARPVTLTEKP